jgi:hypothetical protein
MPQILAPYSPYDGLGGLVKALSIAAGLNIDLDNTNADRNQGALAEGPSVPESELQLLTTCTRHPACTRELGHSGRCRVKAKIQTKDILPDATGHRQCPYEKDCINEAGHRGRCKIRPKPATETPAQPSPTATRQEEDEEDDKEEEDSGTTVDLCSRNPGCTKDAGHVGRCSGGSGAKKAAPPPPPAARKVAPKEQKKKLVAAPKEQKKKLVAKPALPPRKPKTAPAVVEYASSESEEEEEEEEESDHENASASEEEEEMVDVVAEVEDEEEEEEIEEEEEEQEVEILIPKWPARKRPRGRISGVQSDRKEPAKTPRGSGSTGRGGRGGGGRGGGRGGNAGRPSSAAPPLLTNTNNVSTGGPAAGAAAPVARVLATTPPLGNGGSGGGSGNGMSLVQQCRELEAALEVCGVTALDRLSYSMKFAALPLEVRDAQWDALRRHIEGGNVEAVVAAVAVQARARY